MEQHFITTISNFKSLFIHYNKMKAYMKFGIVLLITATAFINGAKAQYMQFTENKGQWTKEVKYFTDMKGGALFLKATGYKVQLDNPDDSKRIAEYFSGHKMHADTAVHANDKNQAALKTAGSANDTSSTPSLILHSHAYEVSFLNADASAEAVAEKPLSGVSNYFIGNDKSKWAAGCRSFTTITYHNIYKNIDLRYYSDNGNLKYDLIVKPGADISKLALKYDGLDNISLNKYGNIVLKTSVGEAYEQKPYSYQAGATGRNKIDAKYVVEGNVVKFKLGNYDKNQTLIIDPALIFSTFIGSTSDNWGYTATYDGSGNFYAGGIVFANGYRYRQTNGAFQTTYQGGSSSEGTSGYDIGISKFDPTGKFRLYATYLGGSGDEQPHSLIIDSKGELVISGRTSSGSTFPVTTSNYGTTGGFDIFLARLSPDGTQLLGSRLIGGAGTDGVNINPKSMGGGTTSIRRNYGDDARSEVIVDSSDNIYLASCTQSKDFPVSSNASQKTLNGNQDGVFIKASPDLETIYNSTYIGGNGDDAAFVLAINPKDRNVFIGGATTSTSGLAQNASNAANIIRNSFGGGTTDGFVTILGNGGSGPLVKTVYIGGSGVDMLYGLQFDKFGFPYVMGTTTVSFPVTSNAAWSQASGKQFITKLKPDLTNVEYSTNFGTNSTAPNISPVAFLVDVCENVYVSGWGGIGNENYQRTTTLGLSTTPDAGVLSNKTDGSDFYFFVLEKNAASQLFGAFFGIIDPAAFGDHVDGGTSRFDKRGVIYQALCANCLKAGDVTSFTSAGVYSPSNPASNGASCNEAAVKVAFEFSGVISSIRASVNGVIKNTGCVPLQVDFTDTLGLGTTYIWDFGDGSKRDTTATSTDSHIYDNVGRYSVMLISIDSSTCNISDTSFTTVIVKDNEAKLAATYEKLPPCQSLNFQFTNNSVAPASFPFGSNSFTWDFGDGTAPVVTNDKVITHQFAAAGTYNVVLRLTDTSYCNAPDSLLLILRVSDILRAQFVTPPTGCAPYNATIENTTLGGETFAWDFGDGTTSTTNELSFTHLYENPGTYTISLSVADRFTCNPTDDTSITITVYPAPVASFNYEPTEPKENTPVTFFNTSTGGVRYHWDFGDGDTLVTTSLSTPVIHQYNASGIYKACLVVYNENNCSDDTCIEVNSIVTPLVDVPNAFSPNNDGINDVVSVKGYGISKMNWRIYNRWGQMVHKSSSVKDFWDGKVNGVLQAQDVYTYVLDVTFSDEKTYRKNG